MTTRKRALELYDEEQRKKHGFWERADQEDSLFPSVNESTHLAWILNPSESFILDLNSPSQSKIIIPQDTLRQTLYAETPLPTVLFNMVTDFTKGAEEVKEDAELAKSCPVVLSIQPSIKTMTDPTLGQCPTWDRILMEWGGTPLARYFFYTMLGRLVSPLALNREFEGLMFTILCADWTGFPLIDIFKTLFPAHEVWHRHQGESSKNLALSGIGTYESYGATQDHIYAESHRRWFYMTNLTNITTDRILGMTYFETFPVFIKRQHTRYIHWKFPGFAMIQKAPQDQMVANSCFGFHFKHPGKQYKVTAAIYEKLRSEFPSVLVKSVQQAQEYGKELAILRSNRYKDNRQNYFHHSNSRVWFQQKFGQEASVFMPPLCTHAGCTHFASDCARQRAH